VLFRVEDIETIEIRAQVQESQLRGVRQGSTARVLADAYPDEPLAAVVRRILPRVDPEQGTVTVLLSLEGATPVMLMDGMAADIAILDDRKQGVVRIPAGAVVRDSGGAAVWVRSDEGFVKREVKVGPGEGYWAEVTSGLKPGDVIRLP
jgi:HlyD family secretion protein